jgi:hypothetical protein
MMSSGVDPNYQPVAANASSVPSFTITELDRPLWFYCKQTGSDTVFLPIRRMILQADHLRYSHCQQGMVFAVNPTAKKTFEAF